MENASDSSDVSSKRRLKTPMHLLQDGGVYFLGSKIRIISKAKCRYEGIFYCFNDDDYTIALSSVRALGTEDRKVERFVAPRDEVYTYIVFKIGDITDIEIVETMMMENFESLEDNEVRKYHYRVPTPV